MAQVNEKIVVSFTKMGTSGANINSGGKVISLI